MILGEDGSHKFVNSTLQLILGQLDVVGRLKTDEERHLKFFPECKISNISNTVLDIEITVFKCDR